MSTRIKASSPPQTAKSGKAKRRARQRATRKSQPGLQLKSLNAQIGGPRVSRKSLSGHPLFGSNNFVSSCDSLPAAFVDVLGNSTFLKQSGTVRHPMMGIDGVRLVGCQPCVSLVTTAVSNDLVITDLATIINVNRVQISPDRLNGPLAGQANFHKKYVFRDIIFEYVSNVSTSQAGSFAMGIVGQEGSDPTATTFGEIRQLIPSITSPFRIERAYLHYHYDGMDTFFVEYDDTSSASLRQTVQGFMIAFPSATSIGAVTQGYVNVWYNIELYEPVPSQGVTLRSVAERKLVQDYLYRLRRLEVNKFNETVSMPPTPVYQSSDIRVRPSLAEEIDYTELKRQIVGLSTKR